MLSKTLNVCFRKDFRQSKIRLGRTRVILGLVAAVILATFAGAMPAAAQNRTLPLYTFNLNDPVLRTIDPLTGETLTEVVLTSPGQLETEGLALAIHPTTGDLYAVLRDPTDFNASKLVIINPADGVYTVIGNIVDPTGPDSLRVSDLAFADDGTLYGVTARDGGDVTNTLFTINLTTAAATLLVSVADVNNRGNAIAFNPEDQLIYHVTRDANTGLLFMQKINPVTLVKTVVVLSGDTTNQTSGLEYFGNGMFLFVVTTDPGNELFIVKATGEVRFLTGVQDVDPHGLAFAGTPPACPPNARLYGAAIPSDRPGDGPSVLYSIDPATGAATLIGPIGFERVSGIDFNAAGVLFATGERQDGTDTDVLLTINPCTGLGTEVGITNLAGAGGNTVITDISFRPSDGVLFGYADTNDTIVTINTTTGLATLVGPASATLNFFGNAIAFSLTNTLFHDTGDDGYGIINQATGESVFFITPTYPVTLTVDPRHNAWASDPVSGVLFGSLVNNFRSNSEHFLSTVNTTTGVVTIVGATQTNLDAIAFLPAGFLADLEITKVADFNNILVGVALPYTITVTNNGPIDATGVIVVDDLPADLAADSASFVVGDPDAPTVEGDCDIVDSQVTCDLGDLPLDDPVTLEVFENTATIEIVGVAGAIGTLDNTATVSGDQTDSDPANNSSTSSTTVGVATFTVGLSPTSGSASAGGTLTFTATVTTTSGNIGAPITMDCLVLSGPAVLTCAFVPPTVTPNATSASSTLTARIIGSTGVASLGVPPSSQPAAPLFAVWLGLPALAFFGTLAFSGRRKRVALALGVALLVLSLLPIAGCNQADPVAPPPQTVTFAVRGTIGGVTVVSNSATITVP